MILLTFPTFVCVKIRNGRFSLKKFPGDSTPEYNHYIGWSWPNKNDKLFKMPWLCNYLQLVSFIFNISNPSNNSNWFH